MKKTKYPTLKLLFLVFFILLGFSVQSAETSSNDDLAISLGNLCEYVGKIQINESGDKNICSFMPSLSMNYDYFLTDKFALSPQIGLTLPKSGRDEHIKSMTLFALFNSKYKTSYVNFIGGLGFYYTRIWGPGGEQVLNNGNTSDSFPLPKDPVYTRNLILNLGLGHDFTSEVSGEFYTYIFNALENEERAFSIGIALSYHFGEIL